MKKFLSILASAAVLAMPLAVVTTAQAASHTGAPMAAPMGAASAPKATPAEKATPAVKATPSVKARANRAKQRAKRASNRAKAKAKAAAAPAAK